MSVGPYHFAADADIPKNLGRNALRRLRRHRHAVQELVQRTNKIPWMERAGRVEPWDEQVVRVRDFEAAKDAGDRFTPVSVAIWEALGDIGRATGRFNEMEAAEEYWIARFNSGLEYPSYPDETLAPQVHSDIVGALREIILDDLVSIHFFREAIDWYERGHWRCAVLPDGRRIIW